VLVPPARPGVLDEGAAVPVQFDDDPEEALAAARTRGWLLVPTAGDSEQWESACSDWEQYCYDEQRAAITVFVETTGRAVVVYSAPTGPSHAGRKLDDAGSKIAEKYCDSRGFAAGPFGNWCSVKLLFDEAERVAGQMRRLDRFARDKDGALAFEEGWHEKWELASAVMTT